MTDAAPLEDHLNRQFEIGDDFFWHRVRWSVISSYLPEGAPFEITDCGAGTGILGRYLTSERPLATYRYVEPIDSLDQVLREQFGEANRLGIDEPMTGSDYVTLLDVLEHIEDDDAFIRSLADRMRPGATLLLTVPAMARLWSAWDVSLGHYRRYDKKTLAGCLTANGFEIAELDYLFPEMIPAGIVRRRRFPAAGGAPPNDAEFPELPPAVNRALTIAGLASSKLRRLAPAGTSLLAVAVRK